MLVHKGVMAARTLSLCLLDLVAQPLVLLSFPRKPLIGLPRGRKRINGLPLVRAIAARLAQRSCGWLACRFALSDAGWAVTRPLPISQLRGVFGCGCAGE
jgi:hypothetical protein